MNRERIARLEGLLERIQLNTARPRSTHTNLFTAETTSQPAALEPIEEAPVQIVEQDLIDEPPPETVGAHVPQYRAEFPVVAVPERPIPAPELLAAPEPEPFVEAVSGEFAVAEMPMELEELGPADEDDLESHVVEIDVDDRISGEVAPAPPLEIANDERSSEPPASGRELVAVPHESARVAVAAPVDLREEDEPPPESARNLKVAPAIPQTSDVFDLEPQIRVEPIAARPIDPRKLVDVVRPAAIADDVAAFTSAARAPRPETFGTLLDAALDL